MTHSHLTGQSFTHRRTPQSEPIPGSGQVPNSAGGHGWELGSMDRLRRFLILGTEGGSYYASERELTRDAAGGVRAALDEHGRDAVFEIGGVSAEGRAPKNDNAIFALAMASAHDDEQVREAALALIPIVCRTGTHLFMFCEFVEGFRGWGRALRRAVGEWYARDPKQVAYQLVKYRERFGVTHADVLRRAHVDGVRVDVATYALVNYVTQGLKPESNRPNPDPDGPIPTTPLPGGLPLYRDAEGLVRTTDVRLVPIEAFERAQRSGSPAETVKLIGEYGTALPREAIQGEHLATPEVTEALIASGVPMTALIRNLASYTRYGVLAPMGATTKTVCSQITDGDALRKARVHPIALLSALLTYKSGISARGSNTWEPVREISDALNDAFYLAFQAIEPTGKRFVLGLDVSGSMTYGEIAGVPGLTPNVASAAMAMLTARTEENYVINGFSHEFRPLGISARDTLDQALERVRAMSMGRTDCALPMLWALDNGVEADVFVVYTDNETWAGQRGHPAQALQAYREKTGIPARLVVVGMTATGFSIADPTDPGMLDVVGFDTAAPQLISAFASGRV